MHPDNHTLPEGTSIVIPVYNSEKTLEALVGRIALALQTRCPSYEVLLVNDGSADASWAEIVRLAKQDTRIRGIDLMRNYGQHNALLCGIRMASYATTVTIDDDLQNRPEDIPLLITELKKGHDVVYGYSEQRSFGIMRNMVTVVVKASLRRLIGTQSIKHISSFRAFRTAIRNTFSDYRNSSISIDVLLSWGTSRFAAVPVHHDARVGSKSNYTLTKLISYTLNVLLGFSSAPLRFATLCGFFLTLFGIGIFIYIVAMYLVLGSKVAGFPFLASIISIFSGAQLFGLGMIGEYMGRIYFGTMQKPSYVVAGYSENAHKKSGPGEA